MRIISILALCIAVSAVTAQATEITSPTKESIPELSCSNPLTARLLASSNEKVKAMVSTSLIKAPEGGFKVCTTEWNAYSSCCHADKLTAVAQEKIDAWANRMNSFLKRLKKVESHFIKRLWHIKNRVDHIKKWIQHHEHKANGSPRAITVAKKYAENFEEILSFFDEKSYQEKRKRFTTEIKECFEKVRDFRLNSMCYQCSGRAASLITAGKLNMSEEACTEVVKSCAGSWDFMYQFMQSVKSVHLLSKIRKSEGSKSKVELKKGDGPDTSEKSPEIIGWLKTVANIEKSSIVFTDTVGNICSNIFVFDGFNDDIAGDDKLMDEVEKEEEEEKSKEEKLPSDKKKEIEAQIAAMKKAREVRYAALKKEIEAKIIAAKTLIAAAEKAFAEAKTQIEAQRKIIEAKKAELAKATTDAQKAELEKAIKAAAIQMETLSKTAQKKHKEVLHKIREIFSKCPHGMCDEFKGVLKTYFSKYNDERKKVDDVERKQAEEFVKKLHDYTRKVYEEVSQKYKEGMELYKKIQELKAKQAVTKRILQTTDSLTDLQNKLKLVKEAIAKKLLEFKTFVDKWYSEYGKFVNPHVHGFVKQVYVKMEEINKFIAEKQAAEAPKAARVLQTTSSATSGVTVSSNTNSATLPKSEDNPPKVSTAAPQEQGTTNNQTNFSSVFKLGFLVALLVFFH